jgi:ABC-type dipeptide/oligopeptide/nickel transport system permease subunit
MMRDKIKGFLNQVKDFWGRYKKNRIAVLGLCIFIFYTILAIGAPYIAPYDPYRMDLLRGLQPPNPTNLFGTDLFGRDMLSRLIWGAQASLFIGFVSTSISQLIGVTLGAIAGYYGGKIDELLMRLIDVVLVIPSFFVIILIVSIYGSSMINVMIVIGLLGWPGTARLIRAEFLSLKEKVFVEASKTVGASNRYIVFSEILPNAMYVSIVNASMQIAGAIMTEASLSFLGLGDPMHVSWGWMLNDARKTFRAAYWTSVFPGLFILIVVLAFNVIGDGINDALNPYLKER